MALSKEGFNPSEVPSVVSSVKTTLLQRKRYIIISLLTTVLLFYSFNAYNSRDHRFDRSLNLNGHGPLNWGPPPPFPPPPHHHRPHHGHKSFLADRISFSERLYQESVKERNEAIEELSRTESTSTVVKLWDLFAASFACPHRLQLFGKYGDNPKWVCGFEHVQNKKCVVYSIGLTSKSSFEETVVSRASECEVFAYDLTVQSFGEAITSSEDLSSRAHLYQMSVGARDEPEQDVYSLSSLMSKNEHNFIDILKIDIEEGALDTLEAFFDEQDLPEFPPPTRPYPPPRRPHHPEMRPQLPIGQLQIAVSDTSGVFTQEFNTWWQKLEKVGLRPFWASPRLGANGDYLGIVDYSFMNIRGDHAIVSSQQHGPHRPHHPHWLPSDGMPPPPPPPSFGFGPRPVSMLDRLRVWFSGPNPRPFPSAWRHSDKYEQPPRMPHLNAPTAHHDIPALHMHDQEGSGPVRPNIEKLTGAGEFGFENPVENHLAFDNEEPQHLRPPPGSPFHAPPPPPPFHLPPPFHPSPPPPLPPPFRRPPPPVLTTPPQFIRVEGNTEQDRQPLQDQVFGEWKLFSDDEDKGEPDQVKDHPKPHHRPRPEERPASHHHPEVPSDAPHHPHPEPRIRPHSDSEGHRFLEHGQSDTGSETDVDF
ncbi:hypothetical protein VKT23_013529 [Stygiomarasmius scandens]|uniref:Methyltransferase domain-containing protein n=1 Tax=Marasmiellus scandens TaxID=2682957 RepID=A0ABR1J7C3_9AGAR